MACACQTNRRQLLLCVPNLNQAYPELIDLSPGESWQLRPELEAIEVTLGPDCSWQTLRELVNFLRSIIDEPRLEEVKASWAHHCGATYEPLPDMTEARPITTMVPLDASPLNDLLAQQRLETWYQPVVTRDTYAIWGYECLMRGRDAAGNLIAPNKIIDWARQEQMIFMLDRLCRETHLHSAGAAALPPDTRLLINFLPTTVYDPQFCLRTTVKAAAEAGIAAERIIFEVVESDKITDYEHLLSILAYYRNAGFSVALDDVGTGYSGLMMLADMNPDLIKIDRALVTRASSSRLHQGICRSLVELAADSGKLSLAEGVETHEQRQLMESLGVDLFQGFLFGKPNPEPMHACEMAA
jgi:EAL domain-containing protein (putative c-di-GMP-specific phosphodiesterase class I)